MMSKYTIKDVQAWQRYYDAGHTLEEVSAHFEVPVSSAAHHINTRRRGPARKYDASVKRRAQLLYDLGFSVSEVSDRVEPSASWLLRNLDTEDVSGGMRRKSWESTWEKARRAANLYHARDKTRQIDVAERMGISQVRVSQLLDIYRNPSDYAPR